MMKVLPILFALAILCGMALATDTAVTSVNTLTGHNDDLTETYWGAAPTSADTQYVAYSGAYEYFVAINATSVGTAPMLNILAGGGPAFRSSIGNLSVSLTANRTLWVGPLESARFVNATGYLKFSTTNVTTAEIMVLKVAS